MKQLQIKREFTVEKQKEKKDLYAEYIKKTSVLIQRPYVVTFKLVEHWEPAVMANLYDECISKYRNRGFTSPSMMWWTERKKLSTQDS